MKPFKLKDVCLVSKGKTITRATATEGDVPVIGGGLGPTYFHSESNCKVPVITISASGANAGFVNYWNVPIWASDCTTIIEKPESKVLLSYVYKFLKSKQEYINSELRRGSAQPHVYPSDIGELEIILPSLEEQLEIIENLDDALSEIDLLEENFTKSISLNTKLLSAKINSEFIAIWDSSRMHSLGDLARINYGFTAKSSPSFSGPKYLRITDIQNKFVSWADVPHCEITSEEKEKFLLAKGDIVFARTGATTGKSYLIDSEVDAVFASYLIRLRPDTSKLDPEFLYYFFQSSYYWDEIAGGISGSAQGGFNASKLQAMKISIPADLISQKEVVKRIREFENELNIRMKQDVNNISKTINLRSSILHRAFLQAREVSK